MTTPAGPPEVSDTLPEEAPFPPAVVAEMLRNFSKTVKAHQMYLPNNPMHARATEMLAGSFASLWQQTDEIVLEITESQFTWFGHPVLEEPERTGDSLPWIFFKDGIRELTIKRGFEQSDLRVLLELIQRVRVGSADDDDLLTLFWECEFAALDYRYVEAGGGGDGVPFDAIEAGERPKKLDAPRDVEAGPAGLASSAPTTPSGVVRMDDFDSTLYFLDQKEIDYLRSEIEKDYSQDLRPSIIAALLDTFEQQADIGIREEIARILDNLLIILLSTTQIKTAAYLLREAGATAQRTQELTDVQRQRFQDLPQRLSEPAALTQMLQALDLTPLFPPQNDLGDLLTQLRPQSLETIFAFVTRTQNQDLRTHLEAAADRLAVSNTAELVRLISSSDPAVALEAIQRSAALKTAAAVPALGQVLTESVGAAMRLAAVIALNDIGSPGALQLLEKAIEDTERDIRIAAARALAARAYRAALPRVDRAIRGKNLRESNLTEKMAFFDAFGALAGDPGVDLLDQILNGKGTLGKRDDAEYRACAATALGRINTRRARESLEKAAAEKEVIVRTAVTRALRGGVA